MLNPIITVIGGTGNQGGGVVDALLQRGRFAVRVPTRNTESERALALKARGVEVVAADLHDRASLTAAFAGSHGVFLVTNAWDPSTEDEVKLAALAIAAAKEAGVRHLVWSTLPNVASLSGGAMKVPHFSNKALVEPIVKDAGFETYTFVEAPLYFQNFLSTLAPQPLGDGSTGWAVPMDPARRCIHAGDVNDVGRVVARVFEQPDEVDGKHLAVGSALLSWNDLVATLKQQGHDHVVKQVPADLYDGFYPGAPEMREMFQWFEAHTYFGPDAETKRAQTRSVYPEDLTTFADWAREHLHTPN